MQELTELSVEASYVQWCLKIHTESKEMERPSEKLYHEQEPSPPASQGKRKRKSDREQQFYNFILNFLWKLSNFQC